MNWADFLKINRVRIVDAIESRREAIHILSEMIADDLSIEADAVEDALLAREKLGSTAIGKGVGLPHAKVAAVSRPIAALLLVKQPLECTTPDDVPLDIVIGFLAPAEGKDLSLLSQLVKQLRDKALLERLRGAQTPQDAITALEASGG